MNVLSKVTSLAAASAMVLSLAACGGGSASTTPTPSTAPNTTTPAEGTATYTVGICQQMTHDALDAATQGFKDALNELLPNQVEFIEQDAGGEYTNCGTIMDGFVSQGVDLILANATYPLQAAASATADIPILGTSVTVGGNISGTSDLAPLDQQADMLNELFPDATNVGLLYCSGEPNSVYQVETIQGYLEDMGYTCEQYAFTDVNDLSSVAQTACDNSDVIYIPTDNTAAANTETIANVVIPAGVPVIAGESGICSGCGVATLSISYYDIGYTTGEMAAKVLTGEADISTMPVEYAPNVTKMYNAANCEALGLTMPEDYEPIA